MTDDWLQLQRRYWDEWSKLGLQTTGVDTAQTNPWEAAMDHWWEAIAPAAPDPSRGFMEKMLEQGKMFFRMGEAFTRDLSASTSKANDGWSGVAGTLQQMQKAFAGDYAQGEEALHKMLAFWELPYDNWQRMMSSLSPIPGDLLRNMPHDQVKDNLQRFLSAPGLGYAREEQSQYQDLLRRTMGYQKALQNYLGFFSHIGIKSTDRMRETLETLQQEGKRIDSARALYDTWVGCCEAVYSDEVRTPEYARIHGELVNAQMALKQRMSVMVDEALGALNMPTRSELRTLQDRLQETRREQKALRHELEMVKKAMAPAARTGAAAATPGSRSATAPRRTPAPSKKAPVRKKAVTRRKTAAKAADK